jgi:asparagine synthase (glutamine-hydrolysing)
MCGLTGIIIKESARQAGNLPSLDLLKKMTDRIAHRGPDDEGYLLVSKEGRSERHFGELRMPSESNLPYQNSGESFDPSKLKLAFGHRRLSIIDLSESGHQPMSDVDGDYWMVYNGEIFNFIELRKELEEKGHAFNSESDSEVLLVGYKEWGKDILNKLDGFYSILIYDKKRNIVFGARDRTGVKPFYYAKQEFGLVFGSEIKCFFDLPGFSAEINDKVVCDLLYEGKIDCSQETIYSHVLQLMPSHTIEYNLGSDSWKISQFPFEKTSINDYSIEAVRNTIEKSVKRRLVSDVKIGFALSGGLDSTILTYSANKFQNDKLDLFSSNSEDKEHDESQWQEIAAEGLNGNWHRSIVNTDNLLSELDSLCYMQDSPIVAANNFAHFQMMKTVYKMGVKVLFNGQGADELFGGYAEYFPLYYLSSDTESRKNLLANINNSPIGLNELKSKVFKKRLLKSLPGFLLSILRKKNKPFTGYVNQNVLKHSENPRYSSFSEYLKSDFFGQRLQEMLHWEDRNTMAFGIEARNPFADDMHLAEMALSAPDSSKIHNGWSKYALREAFKGIIPEEIRTRTDKKGFSMPEIEWNRKWKSEILKSLDNSKLNKYVDTKRLKNDASEMINSDNIHLHKFLFRVMSLSHFLNLDRSKSYEVV